jgi:ribonuclease HII
MALILAGIDEAGYGPTLGPMTVALSVWRIESWDQPEVTPNLWKLLAPAVSREPARGGAGRNASAPVAIADSKKLKRPNDSKSVHPLAHLERGVLGVLGASAHVEAASDDELLAHLAGHGWRVPWYDGEPVALPLAWDAAQRRITANLLRGAMNAAGVRLLEARCRLVWEDEFNRVVRETGSKGHVTLGAVGEHLRRIIESLDAITTADDAVQIACDRLGGRESYGEELTRHLPGWTIESTSETQERSRYWLTRGGRRVGVCFQVEAEASYLPVAFSSMIAKYVRELAMGRFNRYWSAQARDLAGIELKPTAGYATDARRWLDDGREVLSPTDRSALVRIA